MEEKTGKLHNFFLFQLKHIKKMTIEFFYMFENKKYKINSMIWISICMFKVHYSGSNLN